MQSGSDIRMATNASIAVAHYQPKLGATQWLVGNVRVRLLEEPKVVVHKAIKALHHRQIVARLTPPRLPLLHQRFIFSSNIFDVDTMQLAELWSKTLQVKRDPKKIAIALRNSYAIVVVLERFEEATSYQCHKDKIVGFGRVISDGAFMATICDVVVDPAYQRRGIGRRIIQELVQITKKRERQLGFAVFPPPTSRLFFWMIGFRFEKKYQFMAYRGQFLDERKIEHGLIN